MACGCGGSKAANFTYVVVAPNGEQRTYTTEMEARAALTRLGGGAIQKVPTGR